jgi:hypothetical protein
VRHRFRGVHQRYMSDPLQSPQIIDLVGSCQNRALVALSGLPRNRSCTVESSRLA